MKSWTRYIALVVVVVLILMVAACGGGGKSTATDSSQKVVFKLGHVNGVDSVQQMTGVYMNELLAQRLPKYTIDIYPNSQFGGERDMSEAVQLGSQDLLVTASTPLANFVPEIEVLEILYLIQSNEHADAVLEGEYGQELLDAMSNHGIKGLGWTETGWRHFCSAKKPINALSDIAGLKLRVMEHQLHVQGWKVMGVDAITTSWSDAMTGMQQGTMDAIEVPWSIFWPNGVYDVCKNVAETYHLYCAQAFIMSEKAWNSMSPDEQKIFAECAKEATYKSKHYNRDMEASFRKKAEDTGVVVTEPDLTEWRNRGEEVVKLFSDKYGEQIKKIQALNPNK
jgi:tripartite ATP-independent transporter DctP family solute receptor